jgi:predicted GTPase
MPTCPELRGYRLVLLDTPGFDDTHEEDVEILKRIAKWLEVS